ncbi:MAG TPA: hypothetical protein VGU20_06740 [Stellaceae bacterium]|nr:hypothetical protein [Stellaceae bacterium]
MAEHEKEERRDASAALPISTKPLSGSKDSANPGGGPAEVVSLSEARSRRGWRWWEPQSRPEPPPKQRPAAKEPRAPRANVIVSYDDVDDLMQKLYVREARREEEAANKRARRLARRRRRR